MGVATVIVAGSQLTIATVEWQSRTTQDGLARAAVPHVIAAALLLAGMVVLRLPHVRLRKILILTLGIGAIYYISPDSLYFDTLGIGYTPSAVDFPAVLVVGLYLLTPLMMLVLAFVLLKGLPVRAQTPYTESPYVHRSLLNSENEWKPVLKQESDRPVRMPFGFGMRLTALIVMGTIIGFACTLLFNSRWPDLSSPWVAMFDYDSYSSIYFYGIFHPIAMVLFLFVAIAVLWKHAAHKTMARVMLGMVIGMQTLIVVGMAL